MLWRPTVCVCDQILSLLPSNVLRLMEFLGFSGDRVGTVPVPHTTPVLSRCSIRQKNYSMFLQELGLSELREGATSASLRSILSTLTLLMFHLYISVTLGEHLSPCLLIMFDCLRLWWCNVMYSSFRYWWCKPHWGWSSAETLRWWLPSCEHCWCWSMLISERVGVRSELKYFPHRELSFFSTLHGSLYSKGISRLWVTPVSKFMHYPCSDVQTVWSSLQAQEKFLECIATQKEWRHIHHLCYWELMWAYSFELNWKEAYRYANLLCKENKWSPVRFPSEVYVHSWWAWCRIIFQLLPIDFILFL